jgi:hypothetical protein
MYIGIYVKYPFFLSDFNKYFNTPDRFPKNAQISNFIKFRPRESSCFKRTDRQKDTTKAILAFHNFSKASKRRSVKNVYCSY